jgi:acetyltransferase-like isoleucine patch superfamily enzyme
MMFQWNNYIKGSEDLFTEDPWNVRIEEFIKKHSGDPVFIHPTSTVEEGVVLKGPVYIGPNCFVGAHAYLRGGVYLMGNNSIGPGCELKTCILFPNTNLAHFNFVGDSILGSNVNMEAGSIIANHFNERTDKEIFPGVTKFGALIGDGCKVGANAVLSPGTILEKDTVVARTELINQNDMGKKGNKFNWRDLFINKIFDLLMVVLGVTIAFQLNNSKGNADRKSLERFYKESLLVDVNTDIQRMTDIVNSLEKDHAELMAYLPLMDKLPADSLAKPLMAVMSFETFSEKDNTYRALVASNGFGTFNDHQLIEIITEYYSSYTAIRRFEQVYTEVIFKLSEFMARSVIFDQGRIVDKSVTSAPQTRNLLFVTEGQLNTGLEDYEDALNRAKNLKMALEKSL